MILSQAERLRSMIEEEILSFKLRPGDRLDESRLAEKYGTSRTPVREALRQLSANGLIELRPHKGAVVAKLGIRDILEILEVMAELEGACGRLAARACFKSDIDSIAEALEECRELARINNADSYASANETFHAAIYQASRNRYLCKLALNVRNRVSAFRRLQLHQFNRLGRSVEEHTRIFEAIRSGQPEEADRLLQMHILTLGTEMRQLIAMLAEETSSDEPISEPISVRGRSASQSIPVK